MNENRKADRTRHLTESSGEPLIQLKHIQKIYPFGDENVRALKDLSLEIEKGEFVAIMGPSGSGKSTLMHVIGLLDTPSSGSYTLLGQSVETMSEDELSLARRNWIGFVFQQFYLLPRLTALQNVLLPQMYAGIQPDITKAEFYLEMVGLKNRLHHKPNQLSGGQQQRVAIARALINNPKIILADEPTGNLDSKSEEEILSLLSDLHQEGMTIILVTHEESVAQHAKRRIRMRDGEVYSDQNTSELKTKKITAERSNLYKLNPEQGFSLPTSTRFLNRLWPHVIEGVRSLMANKIRSFLSMFGILIGVAAVISMLALGKGAKEDIEKNLSFLGSNLLIVRPGAYVKNGAALESGLVSRLDYEDGKIIQQSIPMVKNFAAEVDGKAQVSYKNKNWNTFIVGTMPSYEKIKDLTPPFGMFFSDEDNDQRRRVAVIGMTIINKIFPNIDPIGEYIKIDRVPFLVIGILPIKGYSFGRDADDEIIIPLNTAMKRLFGKEYVDLLDIEVNKFENLEKVEGDIITLLRKRHHVPLSEIEPFEIRNLADIRKAITKSNQTMTLLLSIIAAISLLVGGVGIMNIMLVSVIERTKEIGLRKAIGANRKDILSQFIIEAVVVSCGGGLGGILFGVITSLIVSILFHIHMVISGEAILISTFFSVLVGLIFGIWPAMKASLLSPMVALRYE